MMRNRILSTASKRTFTLLEVMIGFMLIVFASGAVGWRIHGFLEKKRVQSDVDQIVSRIRTLQQMALNMQSDWSASLKRRGKKWSFVCVCSEQPGARAFAPLHLRPFSLSIDGQEAEEVIFEFFSTGEVSPPSQFVFRRDDYVRRWNVFDILHKGAGDGVKKLGPVHPNEPY